MEMKKRPILECSDRCKAPDKFFLGEPWISIPTNRQIFLNPGTSLNAKSMRLFGQIKKSF